jgi:hypothetical protein
MLQYCFGKFLAMHSARPVAFDTRFFDGSFPKDITPRELELTVYPTLTLTKNTRKIYKSNKPLKRFLRGLTGARIYSYLEEVEGYYSPSTLKSLPPTYFDGYWMNCNYIAPFLESLRQTFHIPSAELSKEYQEIESLIERSENSAFVHIRRGDYVTNASANRTHGLCTLDYYQKAVEKLRERIPDCTLFFFSDDIDWVKENLSPPCSYYVSETKSHFEDLQLMKFCSNAIIANSTFSLWGALLQQDSNQEVFYPQNWYQDPLALGPRALPKHWTPID